MIPISFETHWRHVRHCSSKEKCCSTSSYPGSFCHSTAVPALFVVRVTTVPAHFVTRVTARPAQFVTGVTAMPAHFVTRVTTMPVQFVTRVTAMSSQLVTSYRVTYCAVSVPFV